MARSKKKQAVVRKYKDIISYMCPVRGTVTEEKEIIVYGIGEIPDDNEFVNLEEITN